MTNALHLDAAFRSGDLAALEEAFAETPGFPDCHLPASATHCLEMAIYHSPLPFVRTLLDLGADPSYIAESGFPSLIAALSTRRQDRLDLVSLLLAAGAGVHQRGLNDYTPLHYAASLDDPAAIRLLLAHGADPAARTRIDDCATPLEEAERLGARAAAAALREAAAV